MKFFKNIKSNFLRIIFAIALGTLWHYIFDLTNNNRFVAYICPVNESIWEHLKLLFYPVLILSIVELILVRTKSNFIISRSLGLLTGLLSIIVLYFTYSGIIGENYTFVDITIYVVSIFITFGVSGMIKDSRISRSTIMSILCIIIIIAFIVLFSIFTYKPPHIDLFKDKNTNSYSIVTKEK